MVQQWARTAALLAATVVVLVGIGGWSDVLIGALAVVLLVGSHGLKRMARSELYERCSRQAPARGA